MSSEQEGTHVAGLPRGRNSIICSGICVSTPCKLLPKVVLLTAAMVVCTFLAGYEGPRSVSLRSQPDSIVQDEDLLRPIRTCQQCALRLSNRQATDVNASDAIVVPRSRVFGRAGNFVIIITHAFLVARACGYMLLLPHEDELGAFNVQADFATYDFRGENATEKWPLYAYGALVNPADHCPDLVNMRSRKRMQELFHRYTPERNDVDIDNCVRQYLGLCVPGYCDDLTPKLADSLVIHIRQGDIFPKDFNPKVHAAYWQPPLSYYMAAIQFQAWGSLHILSQPTETEYNPILLMLKILQDGDVLPAPATFHQYDASRTWADDVRTMVCAPNIVMSKSTLGALVRLGRARQIFALTCFHYKEEDANVHAYEIPVNGDEEDAVYLPSLSHTNSPTEWVQMLLHPLPLRAVKRCTEGRTFARLY
jgi:hypothetical protein